MKTSFGNNNNTNSMKAPNSLGDFVSFRENKYVDSDDDDDDDDNDDNTGLGREVQFETSVVFTPTKKSARISASSSTKKRAIPRAGADSLISLVKELHVQDQDKEDEDDDEVAAVATSSSPMYVSYQQHRVSLGENGQAIGRVTEFVIDSTGTPSVVLRSSRRHQPSKKYEAYVM